MSNLIRVQRANVILDVSAEDKDKYMDEGYSVIDTETGKIIEKALSKDVNELRKEVVELQEVIKKKDAEIKKLKAAKKKDDKTDI